MSVTNIAAFPASEVLHKLLPLWPAHFKGGKASDALIRPNGGK